MKVALTIDAELPGRVHASPWAAASILDTLGAAGVRATWFMQGRWCRLEPALARDVADAGHLIGSHGMMHAPLTWLHDDGIRWDAQQALEEIGSATGQNPEPWFRCPNLMTDLRVEQVLADERYWVIGADVLSLDWEPSYSPADVRRHVREGVAAGGRIVLLHSWPRTTAACLATMIAELRDAGAEFVTVDQL